MFAPEGPSWSRERHAAARGFRTVAGIDEVGRGALAGPVVAAAVILDPDSCPEGVRDSKTLTRAARERLYAGIVATARAWGVGLAEAGEIDATNILVATRSAMLRAIGAMGLRPDFLIVDAVPLPETGLPFEAPFKADRDVLSVAAASIIAKVTRDRILVALDAELPGYGFAAHKGYGTREHFTALSARGASAAHRRSFAGLGEGSVWSGGKWGCGAPPGGAGGGRYPKGSSVSKLRSGGSRSSPR